MIGQIALETGWPVQRILDTNVITLSLMMADAPHYVPEKKRTAADYIKEMQRRDEERKARDEKTAGVDPLTYFNEMAIRD